MVLILQKNRLNLITVVDVVQRVIHIFWHFSFTGDPNWAKPSLYENYCDIYDHTCFHSPSSFSECIQTWIINKHTSHKDDQCVVTVTQCSPSVAVYTWFSIQMGLQQCPHCAQIVLWCWNLFNDINVKDWRRIMFYILKIISLNWLISASSHRMMTSHSP